MAKCEKDAAAASRGISGIISVMAFDLFTIAGVVGSALVIFAFFANQHGWLSAENGFYSLINLVGAVLILISLITAWNLPAAVIEGFWALISVYALVKHGGWLRRRIHCEGAGRG